MMARQSYKVSQTITTYKILQNTSKETKDIKPNKKIYDLLTTYT